MLPILCLSFAYPLPILCLSLSETTPRPREVSDKETDSPILEEDNKKSPLSIFGIGCAGIGCLFVLLALCLIGAILAGVFNYSLEPQMWAVHVGA